MMSIHVKNIHICVSGWVGNIWKFVNTNVNTVIVFTGLNFCNIIQYHGQKADVEWNGIVH